MVQEAPNQIVIENKNSILTVLDNGILHLYFKDNADLEVEDILDVEKAFNSIEPRPQKVLSEMGKYTSITSEARSFAADRSPDLDGIAYVIQSLAKEFC